MAILRALVYCCLLILSLGMLVSGLFFESAYNAGFPLWLHTTAGFMAAGTGLIGQLRALLYA